MCLIVIKPHGLAMPSDVDMADWFSYHDDGFGLAFQHKNKVQILKGAMTMKEMFGILERMYQMIGSVEAINQTNIMFHFRQTSGGAVIPANCHPFPISNNKGVLASTRIRVTSALAHNGIISAYSDWDSTKKTWKDARITDTQQLIEKDLFPLGERLYTKEVLDMVGNLTESKYALMLPDKVLLTTGFISDDGGMLYSNHQYEWARNYGKGAAKYYGYGMAYDDDQTYNYVAPHAQLTTPKTEAEKINESLAKTDDDLEAPCDTCKKDFCYDCSALDEDVVNRVGYRCELCDEYVSALYVHDTTCVCRECFSTINGNQPQEDDQYI